MGAQRAMEGPRENSVAKIRYDPLLSSAGCSAVCMSGDSRSSAKNLVRPKICPMAVSDQRASCSSSLFESITPI